MFTVPTSHPLGLGLESNRYRGVPQGSAASVGQVWQFDIGQEDSGTTNNKFGDHASGLRRLIQPSATGLNLFPMAVIQSAAAENYPANLILTGRAMVNKGAFAVSAGDRLYLAAGSHALTDTPADGDKVYAVAVEDALSGDGQVEVFFQGIEGFGMYVE